MHASIRTHISVCMDVIIPYYNPLGQQSCGLYTVKMLQIIFSQIMIEWWF